MLEVFHKHGLKVITDLVLSHTSDEHPWFVESQQSQNSKYSDWYVWVDGHEGSPQIIGYQFLVEVRGNGASIETNFIYITF